MSDREFDVVVWGATGFTGRLVAEYLIERYGVAQQFNWAIAGRSPRRLEALRQTLGVGADALPIIVADSHDRDSLDELAGRTRVVCSTVGPYALYGSELVAACANLGTHYCDLTGEVHWMRRMIDEHHESARRSGARIVHTCGFDCIPADMGVHWLQREMRARHGVYCQAIKFRAEAFKGGFSGGTVASMMNMMAEAEKHPEIRRIASDPYALNPAGGPRGLDGPEKTYPEWDVDFNAWVSPFAMAAVDTKVVRRSNALLDFRYGSEFRYDEGILIPYGQFGFPAAVALAGSTAMFSAATGSGMLRDLLGRVLPEPGEGPSREAREKGYFQIQFLGRHPTSAALDLRLRVRGDRDPGYGSTAKMLGESAVCLAKDALSSPGGILTPSVAMGDALVDRLQENAGVTFEALN
ncbi:MAG: saccharopine dehydrogenase NADP-binding domain-containing protein [Pseudomonadales bacterium]